MTASKKRLKQFNKKALQSADEVFVVKQFIRLFHCQDFNYYFSYNFNFELKQINYIFDCQAI